MRHSPRQKNVLSRQIRHSMWGWKSQSIPLNDGKQRQRKLRDLAKGQRVKFIQTPELNPELQRLSLETETLAERHHSNTDAEHVKKSFYGKL